MKLIDNVKYILFSLKCKIYGQYYWVGPEVEVGVCDECADSRIGSYEYQKKVPVRRLIPEDNMYLCSNHWERARKDPGCVPLEPFLRSVKDK